MKRYAAELIGTFVLVFGGCGAAVLAGSHIGFAGVAFAFGFSLLVMAYTIGPISGCHINPAVTFGLLLSVNLKRSMFQDMSWPRLLVRSSQVAFS
jgi:aquaporin Z